MNSLRNFLLGVGATSLLLGASSLTASAQIDIEGTINYIIRGDVRVIGETTFVTGGGVTGNLLNWYPRTPLTINDGVFGSSDVFTGRMTFSVGTTNIYGGTFGGGGGGAGSVFATLRGTVNIYGGTFAGVGADAGYVRTTGVSNTTVYGGRFAGGVYADGNSNVTVNGGSFAQMLAGRVRDNRPGGLGIQDEGEHPTITWNGGTFEGGVFLGFDDGDGGNPGNLHIQDDVPGPELILNGNGLFYETESDHYTNPDLYGDRVFDLNFLSGTLLDGTQLRFVPMLVEHGVNANIRINNVPEPGSIALLFGMASIGGVMLRRKRK